jgi:hypothetical protein
MPRAEAREDARHKTQVTTKEEITRIVGAISRRQIAARANMQREEEAVKDFFYRVDTFLLSTQ